MQNGRATEPDCRPATVLARALGGGALVAALLGVSCIQPDTTADEFGTGGASSVTGDDTPTERLDGGTPDEMTDEDELGTQNDPPVTATPEQPRTPLTDAGRAVTDAGKPRGTDAGASITSDAGVEEPAMGDAGAMAAPGGAATKLSFSVTTSSAGGRYAPRNIYAIWVTDGQGKFVKTLAKFARIRARYLTGWNAASGGSVVDAVTGATVTAHGTRSVTWDFTDASKKPVPDGEYKLVVELTDADRTGVSATVPFSKGAPTKSSPPNQPSFSSMSLVLE